MVNCLVEEIYAIAQESGVRWYPFIGQLGGRIKVDLAIHVYAAFFRPPKYA